MRRALIGALLLGIGGWIAAGAFLAEPRRAEAQTPAVEIHRVQEAAASPGATGKDGLVFILAIGSDARPGEAVDGARADTIQVVAANPGEGAATILGFPRDSALPIPGAGTTKINAAMSFGGPELLVQTVSEHTGIEFDYYMLTSFEGLTAMVGDVGGIEIEIEYPMVDSFSGTNFQPGTMELNGGQALAFTRDRKSAPGGDIGRSENQGRLLHAGLEKLRADFERKPSVLFRWLVTGLEHVQSDISFEEAVELMFAAVQIDPENVTTLVVPIAGSAGGSDLAIAAEAQALYDDIADDAIVESPPE